MNTKQRRFGVLTNVFVAVLFSAMLLAAAAPFSFGVYRKRLTRDEPGQLEISDTGVSYQSENKKTSLTLPFTEIRKADVSDPTTITLEMFDITKRRLGKEKVFTFRLREGTHPEELARFVAEHIKRPTIGAYSVSNGRTFAIPAYHREFLSGAHGKLVIGEDAIRFLSDKTKQSRTWLYRDIETIGSADPFHFRVSTYAETFTFDLKDRLPEDAYRLASGKVYKLEPAPSLPKREEQ
jgi:hypothetical protein